MNVSMLKIILLNLEAGKVEKGNGGVDNGV